MSHVESGVPFLDLAGEFQALRDEWFEAIAASGTRGQFILGDHVSAFEREAALWLGVRHAIGVANGTDALVLALRSLGIGPGDEVITTPFTFFASAEAISAVGARPVFADIDPATFNIDVAQIRQQVSGATRALIPVHLYGQTADMDALNAVAAERGIPVIEDTAQAFGSTWGGRRGGSMGSLGTFSFYPTKVLGGYGDGGLVTTGDDALADAVRRLRNHGSETTFVHTEIGYNSRLDEIQASLLRIKLRSVEAAIAGRRRVAERYLERLADTPLVLPERPGQAGHAWNVFTVRSRERDRLREHLRSRNIGCSVYYPVPMHLQPVYRDLGYREGDFPQAERACAEVLSLPIFPDMREEQIEAVCAAIREAL